MNIGQRHVYQEEAPDPDNNPPAGDPPPADPPAGDPPAGDPPGAGDPPVVDPWGKSAPDDWREQISGEDEGRLTKAQRYNTFGEFVNGAFDAHDRIRKGELGNGLGDNPTDEQLTTYREANGIPVDGKYELSLEEGVKITPDDQAILDEVFPVAFAGNVGTAEMSAITSKFIQARDAQVDKILAQDGQDKIETQAHLKEQWGGDYEVNNQMIDNLLTRELPEDVQELFRTARDGEGKGLLNNPAVVKMLASLERQINPMSTIPGGAENASATAREIVNKAKEYQLAKNFKAYDDPSFQKEYDKAIGYLQSIGEKI